ncbi:hypothetical protein BT96DRAFT_965914 [Gymnopus androsaceus JB14]|uniref:Hemimethylated DNA-binding domain-containing protein n=1 Tax=Gymnopus androsaceus JB14 TaxID=1447944 RepID=A0A6A4HL57_9AGAR|nr:hypothetical protein BT96DRAFT_965914 [Gymnopus androsaceus JB14]
MIPRLPLDILIHILYQLPPSRDTDGDISVKTIVLCSATDSLFREAAILPNLWQHHYQVRYLHANKTAEVQRQAESSGNWRSMYFARGVIDNQHARTLTRFLFDAWDVLEIETGMVDCSEHLKVLEYGEIPSLTATRAYWASALLGSISQMYAVDIWTGLRLGSSLSFVEAFSSTSCFFGKHPDEMSSILTDLNSRCRSHLVHLNVPLTPDDPEYDIKKLCVLICDFMTSEGYGPATSANFHNLSNLFPHSYLTSHKRTIPLSLVHVFVSIARSLGIAASAVDFPIRVICHISVPDDPEFDDFYVDVFESPPQILSLREDIPALLARQGIVPSSMLHHISPCGAAPMLLRSARNILASLNSLHVPLPHHLVRPSTILAFCIYLILPERGVSERIVPQLLSQAEPLDACTFISEALVPCLRVLGADKMQEYLAKGCQSTLEAEATLAKGVRLRSLEDRTVQHFVGQVFEHKKYMYIGLIIGWDVSKPNFNHFHVFQSFFQPVCEASEDWIKEMKVSELPRGKDQPFYSVVCLNYPPQRYVAEDNIKPLLAPPSEILVQMCRDIDILPKFFTGVLRKTKLSGSSLGPIRARARFVLSPELSEAYPEDEAIGDAWLVG